MILTCSLYGGNGISNLEYSEIQYRLCVSPISLVILINDATYSISRFLCTFKIFIADDFTLKEKFTNFESVVKSSKIIQGRLENIPSSSLVCPIRKDFPAVNTGVG